MHRVFVYGTLLRGEHNHGTMAAARGRFIREATTAAGFALFDLGSFPGMRRVVDGRTVIGEVWDVDAAGLLVLDRLEGHPRFYQREWITLCDGEEVQTYLIDAFGCPAIPLGDWRTHRRTSRSL